MMFELAIQEHFSSAHFLRGYDGPCKDLHGHTWKIEVVVEGQKLNDIGLVIDFRQMKKKLREFLTHMDHVNLNDLDYFKEFNPSTENLSKYIYHEFAKVISPIKVKRVRVWESDVASVVYYE